VDWTPLAHGLNVLRPLDAPKDLQV
jgi:hypothetical protein